MIFAEATIPGSYCAPLAGFGLAMLVVMLGVFVTWAATCASRPPRWAVLLVFTTLFVGMTGFSASQWICHIEPYCPTVPNSYEIAKYEREKAVQESRIVLPWVAVVPLTLMSAVAAVACFILTVDPPPKKT